MKKTKQDRLEIILNYFCGLCRSDEVFDVLGIEETQERCDILGLAQKEWDVAECDAEGPTSEQDLVLDAIIEDCLSELI